MELKNVRTFIKVAELENFTLAAAQLGYAQSTITAQIQQLESELNADLFERNGKRIRLSAAGKVFLEYAYQLSKYETLALNQFRKTEEPSGQLNIGIMETLCSSDFTNFFMDFAEKYPKISLKINVVTTLEAMAGLNKGAFDIIFLLDKKIVRPHWKTFRCFPADIFFFCAKNHPLAQKKEVSVQQLLSERFILTEQGCNYRQVFESYLESQGLRLQCLTEIGHTNYIIQAVCRRLGIGLLPIFTLHHALEEEKISLIDAKDYSIRLYIQAIYNTQRCISLPMQTFLQQLEQFSFS